MKILAVDADGLLLEDYRAIPNCDPLPHGLAFYNRLRSIESVLMITRADRVLFHQWALPYNIERTWLINPEDPGDLVSAAQSFAGRQHSTVALFVTADFLGAAKAQMRGIPAALFHQPDENNRLAIAKGPGWASSGYEPVPDTPDTEEDAWR